MTPETKNCQNCQQNFTIEPEDFVFYGKMKVPAPTWCPECRLIRRLSFMNTRTLYKRKCDLCDKSIVSMHAPEKKIKVYCQPCWWSDVWDGTEYGRDWDPQRPFLEQVKDLIQETPFMALENLYPSMINSEYSAYAAYQKNTYLVFYADYCENVLYSDILANIKDTMDSLRMKKSELCYGCIGGNKLYQAFYSEECDSCNNIYFCRNCSNCSDCFGCINLRNKSYCLWNQQYTKEEYQKKLVEMRLGSFEVIEETKKKAYEFYLKYPERYMKGNSLNIKVTGDYVYESKNTQFAYMASGVEDSKYVQFITVPKTKDSYDYTGWGNNVEQLYECLLVGEGANGVRFSSECWPAAIDLDYCYFTNSSAHMLGCVNIRKKQYCILNKEYSKEEFEKLRGEIIKSMNNHPYIDKNGRIYKYGEFFPSEMSIFGYNETDAFKYFPLSQEEAKVKGFNWFESQATQHLPSIKGENLPDCIEEVEENITKEIIECQKCQKCFKIVKPELKLLKKFGLPLPKKCPNCRYAERFNRVNPPQLVHRTCQCAGVKSTNSVYINTATHTHGLNSCPTEFETSYAPDLRSAEGFGKARRPEIVYCEQCYQGEVV